MSRKIKYPDSELVTRDAVDRALKYFHGARTPSNSAETHKKVLALIEVGGLMLFRHRESLLLTVLNDQQRAVLAEYHAATSTQRLRKNVQAPKLMPTLCAAGARHHIKPAGLSGTSLVAF